LSDWLFDLSELNMHYLVLYELLKSKNYYSIYQFSIVQRSLWTSEILEITFPIGTWTTPFSTKKVKGSYLRAKVVFSLNKGINDSINRVR